MMLQNHMLAGYFIYTQVPNPIIGVPLAIASHYALDLVTYPSKEMEIMLQSDLKSNRDRITFNFAMSFMILVSLILLFVMQFKSLLNGTAFLYMAAANLPDFWDQHIYIVRGKRQQARYPHTKEITRNPHLKILIHQIFTALGFAYVLFR